MTTVVGTKTFICRDCRRESTHEEFEDAPLTRYIDHPCPSDKCGGKVTEHRMKWVMPEWMEPYREYLDRVGGGNSVETLMNNVSRNLGQTNVILAAMICQQEAMIGLLHNLRAGGHLK